ncbi:MAG: uridine kinase [bacterium]
MKRRELVEKISRLIRQTENPYPTRVAIDGIDNAGKTTLAAELGHELQKKNRPIIHASIDSFHRTRKERYRRGTLSPDGYFNDSFDLDVLKEKLLKPLGPAGDLRYTKAVFDFRTDLPLPRKLQKAKHNAILLFDGVFLLRPELNAFWNLRIFVQVSFETALRRALLRDMNLFGSVEETKRRYLERYIPGQKMYFQKVNPMHKADIVIDNNDPDNPLLLKGDRHALLHF